MLPGTEQDCEINYDVSQCNFPIWHSTVHVHAVLAGCARYHKSDRGEAERKRAKSSQGRWLRRCHLSWASKIRWGMVAPRMDPSSGWGANEGEEEGKSTGLSLTHTGSNEGLIQDCGKCAWKRNFGQNFEADPTLWCGEKKGVWGRVREEREWRPRLQTGGKGLRREPKCSFTEMKHGKHIPIEINV